MIIKPAGAPPIWAANENYSSGPDAGTLTKVAAAATSDGHIAGAGNAPIAQNENFYRNNQDQWSQYFNMLAASKTFYGADENQSIPAMTSTVVTWGGNFFRSSDFNGSVGQTAQSNGDGKFSLYPTQTDPETQLWEVTAEINFQYTSSFATATFAIVREQGGGFPDETIESYALKGANGDKHVVAIRVPILINSGPPQPQNVIFIQASGSGSFLIIRGQLKIERVR